jgi:hypothetical protein
MTAVPVPGAVARAAAAHHPVLVGTSGGVIGAIVTEPAEPARAAAVLLEGWEGTRAGNDQIWVKIADGLADLGVVSLRHDYAGIGDSADAPVEQRPTSTGELVAWFRERTADLDLLVVATCYGVVPAVDAVRAEGGARAVALVTPATGRRAAARRATVAVVRARGIGGRFRWVRSTVYRRGRRTTMAARRLAMRSYARVRYGVDPGPRAVPAELVTIDAAALARELIALTPVWVLTGGDDLDADALASLAPDLTADGRFELEVVDDQLLHASANPAAQHITTERVLAWARRHMDAVDHGMRA